MGVKGHADLDVEACRIPRNWDERGEAWLRSGHSAKPDAAKITGAPPGNGINADPRGGRPANVVLSHAEGCVARGVRRVKGAARTGPNGGTKCSGGVVLGMRNGVEPGRALMGNFTDPDGTEAVPAYDCLAGCDCGASWLAPGCDCGASWLAPAGGAAGRCEACGGAGWWACPVAEVDAQSGDAPSGARAAGVRNGLGYGGAGGDGGPAIEASAGGASRFFNRLGYYAKCPGGERHAGTEGLLWAADKTRAFGFRRVTREEWEAIDAPEPTSFENTTTKRIPARASGNVHPTVKRIALMRWLHALAGAAPIGDLCAGSGSGAIAAHLDGIDWIGAEVCPEAIEIANARLAWWRGLSHEAARVFLATDVVPQPPPTADPRQAALFGAP